MVTLEALNALYGDCLLLRYPDPNGKEKFWIIDGGPRAGTAAGERISVWLDVLLPRIEDIKDEINADPNKPLPIALAGLRYFKNRARDQAAGPFWKKRAGWLVENLVETLG